MFWYILIIIILLLIIRRSMRLRKFVTLSNQIGRSFIEIPFLGFSYIFYGNEEDRMKGFIRLGKAALKRGGITSGLAGGELYITPPPNGRTTTRSFKPDYNASLVHFNLTKISALTGLKAIADAELADLIMKSCLDKADITKFLRFAMGNGSIFADPPMWRPRRKVLAPTFSIKNLNQFVEVFAKQSNILVKRLEGNIGTEFSTWHYLSAYTLDSVCETALGVKLNSQFNVDEPFVNAFEEYCDLITEKSLNPWMHYKNIYNMLPVSKRLTKTRDYMWEFVDKVIRSKRKALGEQEIRNELQDISNDYQLRTFMDMLMDPTNKGLSDVEIREETLVMVMAGTDTSAVNAGFTLLMLARHQDVQEKVYQELQEIFGDSKRNVTFEDLPRLKYLDVVIKESLRTYPSVPILTRKLDKEIDFPTGVTMIKDTNIVIHIWALHRNPEYWGKDVDQFRPERFFHPLKHPGQFMPFGYGPRTCLGYQYAMMSAKTLLATILQSYRVLPSGSLNSTIPSNAPAPDFPDKTPCGNTYTPIRLKYDIMMKDVNKFPLIIEPRNIN